MDFKVRFLKDEDGDFKIGKVYEVNNGQIIDEVGYTFNSWSMENRNNFESFKTWFENEGCKVELVKDEFTKSDLKDGMVVTYRNGRKRIIINGFFYHYTNIVKTGNTLSDYNDDLKTKEEFRQTRESEDIIKVEYMGIVLWEREKEYMTLEEAYNLNRIVKHKDVNTWCDNVHSALYEACVTTKRDMFELLKAREFEFREI